MKLVISILCAMLANVTTVNLSDNFGGYDACFAMLDIDTGQWTRYNEKRCEQRFSPCSTFKIPNSLIGLESGVVKNVDDVVKWDGVKRQFPAWNQDQTMRTAFKESTVWYYQKLASDVGTERMNSYVQKFKYGNEDTAGGITQFWLGDSLKISANEQCEFLQKLMKGTLPVSADNVAKVKEIMLISQDPQHSFGGKTGSNADSVTHKRTLNWFVGYATNGKHRYVFATNMSGKDIQGSHPAKKITQAVLTKLGVL